MELPELNLKEKDLKKGKMEEEEEWVNLAGKQLKGEGEGEEYVLSSEDYESLFPQFPFSSFTNFLFDNFKRFDSVYRDPSSMLDLCTFLVKRMYLGVISFKGYPYFAKLLGEMMVRILKATCKFVSLLVEPSPFFQRRVDLLCINLSKAILSLKRANLWQLLKHIPFSFLSNNAKWIIFQLFLLIKKPLSLSDTKQWNSLLFSLSSSPSSPSPPSSPCSLSPFPSFFLLFSFLTCLSRLDGASVVVLL